MNEAQIKDLLARGRTVMTLSVDGLPTAVASVVLPPLDRPKRMYLLLLEAHRMATQCASLIDCEDARQCKNAETAGTPDRTSNTSASSASPAETTGTCTAKSGGATAAATTTPPSSGTTASGAGSVAAAVEALRVALSQDVEICADRDLDPGSMRLKIRRAIRAIIALDVPGMLAKAESDAAKLRDSLRVEREACEKKDATIEGLIGSIRHALPHISGIGESGPALFMLDRIVKEFDTRRAAEKNNGGSDAASRSQPDRSQAGGNPAPPTNQREPQPGDMTGKAELGQESKSGTAERPDTGSPTPGDNGPDKGISRLSAPRVSGLDPVAIDHEPGQDRPVHTNNAPVQVTDEDRRIACEWIDEHNLPAWKTERLARLIAKVRHERDGAVRELVEALDKFSGDDELLTLDINAARALVKKHGGAA